MLGYGIGIETSDQLNRDKMRGYLFENFVVMECLKHRYNSVKESNLLGIDVTNLPANRIVDYDRRGNDWRIFNDINFVNIAYKNTHFDNWNNMPSGFLVPVYIKELEYLNPSKSN